MTTQRKRKNRSNRSKTLEIGQLFGRLTIDSAPRVPVLGKRSMKNSSDGRVSELPTYQCICSCGSRITATTSQLLNNGVRFCGNKSKHLHHPPVNLSKCVHHANGLICLACEEDRRHKIKYNSGSAGVVGSLAIPSVWRTRLEEPDGFCFWIQIQADSYAEATTEISKDYPGMRIVELIAGGLLPDSQTDDFDWTMEDELNV